MIGLAKEKFLSGIASALKQGEDTSPNQNEPGSSGESEKEDEYFSGNEHFYKAPDDENNQAIQRYSLHSSSNNLRLINRQNSNSVFKDKHKTPIPQSRQRFLHQKSVSGLELGGRDGKLKPLKAFTREVDESNKSRSSSSSFGKNERASINKN